MTLEWCNKFPPVWLCLISIIHKFRFRLSIFKFPIFFADLVIVTFDHFATNATIFSYLAYGGICACVFYLCVSVCVCVQTRLRQIHKKCVTTYRFAVVHARAHWEEDRHHLWASLSPCEFGKRVVIGRLFKYHRGTHTHKRKKINRDKSSW